MEEWQVGEINFAKFIAFIHAHSQLLKECTVIFRYIYGKHHRIADIRDHDNVENRAVLNVIERYMLVSDSGYYCTNIQQTAFGSSDKTTILLFPGRIGVDPLPDEVLT